MVLWKKNLILILIAVVIVAVPLTLLQGAEFAGSDMKAESLITDINPEYEPWFSGPEVPGEMETFFFCLQTAIGAGIIGFVFGRMSSKPEKKEKKET